MLLKTKKDAFFNLMQSALWKKKIQAVEQFFLFSLMPSNLIIPLKFYDLGVKFQKQEVCTRFVYLNHLNSQLKNIFLVSLFNCQDRVTYGNNLIFEPVIRELNYLEREGIEIDNTKLFYARIDTYWRQSGDKLYLRIHRKLQL